MKKQRDSGLELLKILTMILIVMYHVTLTLSKEPGSIAEYDPNAFINFSGPFLTVQQVILACILVAGKLGNSIFFCCSAWFLLDREQKNNQKNFKLMLDIWCISVLLLLTFTAFGEKITAYQKISSLLPTFHSNNWYMTSYLMIAFAYPYLNRLINQMSQKELLAVSLSMAGLYYVIGSVMTGYCYPVPPLLFLVMYFLIGYIKRYMQNFSNNRRINIGIVAVFSLIKFGLVVLTSLLNSRGMNLNMKVWDNSQNILDLIIAIGLINIFRNIHFQNKAINWLSGTTFYIYLIHENVLVREYFRPRVFMYIYGHFGYDSILLWVLLFAGALFVASVFLGWIYRLTIGRAGDWFLRRVYPGSVKAANGVLNRIMRIS